MRRTIASGHIPLNLRVEEIMRFQPWSSRPGIIRSTSAQSKRQLRERFVSRRFVRLELPLPERTGSDRDKPLCPSGFVDRAYLVFLRNCEPSATELLRVDPSGCSHPLAMFPRMGGRCPMLRLRARGHRPLFRITVMISTVRGIHPDERVRWRCRTLTRVTRAQCLRPLERQFPVTTFATDHRSLPRTDPHIRMTSTAGRVPLRSQILDTAESVIDLNGNE
jgi:hypothetical protein